MKVLNMLPSTSRFDGNRRHDLDRDLVVVARCVLVDHVLVETASLHFQEIDQGLQHEAFPSDCLGF